MLLFNTAPQFVGASNTLHKTNIVETQSYYVDTMGLGVDLCTGLMAFGFASVAQPQMLIEHSSNFVHPGSHMLNLLLHKALLIWCFCTGMLSELHPCVGWLLILPSVDHCQMLRHYRAGAVGSRPWAW